MPNLVQYYFYRLVSAFVCLFPYSLLLFAGKILGRLFYRVATKQRQLALKQVQTSLELSPQAAEQIVRRSFIHLGQTFLEVLYSSRLNKDNVARYITIDNRQYLDMALKEGTGVVVITAHIGNWEWLGAGMALYGFSVASIVKAQPNAVYTRLMNECRQRAGVEVFTRGTTELIGAAKALKKGKMLGFFSDQDGGPQGLFIDFMGLKAATHAGAALFARKFKVPVIPAFIVHTATGRHQIQLGEPFYFEPSDTLQSFTQKNASLIEQKIREYPDEWLWFQKRWDTPCPGDTKEGDAS